MLARNRLDRAARPQVRIDLSQLDDDLFGVPPLALLRTALPA